MKKLLFILLIQLFLSNLLSAQDLNHPRLKRLFGSSGTKFGLHVVPSTLLNYHPRFRFGAMMNRPTWSGIVDLAYGTDWIPNGWRNEENDEPFEDYTFLAIRPELRLHLGGLGDEDGETVIYFGTEMAFTYFERTVRNDDFEQDGLVFSYDRATLQRVRHTLLLKLGINFSLGKSVYCDVYTGAGASFRQFVYKDIEGLFLLEDSSLLFDDLFRPNWKYSGTSIVPDLAFGLRLGIWL